MKWVTAFSFEVLPVGLPALVVDLVLGDVRLLELAAVDLGPAPGRGGTDLVWVALGALRAPYADDVVRVPPDLGPRRRVGHADVVWELDLRWPDRDRGRVDRCGVGTVRRASAA